MTAQDILDIFDRDLAVWLAAPWNEETPWILLHFWIEKTLDIPSSRRIVMAVLILLATKSIAWIEALIRVIQIEMVFLDKVLEIWMTEEVLWIVKFKIITAQLIGVGHIGIIWHPPRHPMVATDGFQPPDFINI